MRVLHILSGGNTGGIEVLCKDYAQWSKHENYFVFLWSGGRITDEMKSNGANVIELSASKKDIFDTYQKLKRICRENAIEALLVHHSAPAAHTYLMMLKKWNPQLLTYAYAHGNAVNMCRIEDKHNLWLRKLLIGQSLKSSNRVIAISESVKESLVKIFGVPENKIVVNYNGVNIERFKASQHPNSKITQLVYVGRLIPDKGVQVILEGLSLLPEDLKYHFTIAGDGPYRETLVSLCSLHGLQDCVTFLGDCDYVPQLLQRSDVFVHMPVWEEGFGITIVEAMAAGLICICARSGAIPEIICDRENGYLIEKNNPQELADRLCSLIGNVYSESGVAIRRNAVETAKKFSIQTFASKLDSILSGDIPLLS